MFFAASIKANQVLFVSYIGNVSLKELVRERENMKTLIGEMSPGFRLLVDFSQFESMDHECLGEIGMTMDLLNHAGIAVVVRVIPDSKRDPGMRILSAFHYRKDVRLVTSESFLEAGRVLGI